MIVKSKEKNEIELNWEFIVEGSLEKVWKYVSDTDRINRAIGSPPVQYKSEPDPGGGSDLYGEAGGSRYKDNAYEWVENRYYYNLREYYSGLPVWSYFGYELEQLPENRVKLISNNRVKLKFPILNPIVKFVLNKTIKTKFANYFEKIKTLPEIPGHIEFNENQKFEEATEANVNKIVERFSEISNNYKLNKKIAIFIETSMSSDLVKIRPYRLALDMKESPKEVLIFFLKGTRAGLFEMNWDVLCPSCRGAKESTHSLKDMKVIAHCDSCNIDYNAEFDKSVELTFTPHFSLKEVIGVTFCAGGPGNTPHILMQQRVAGNSIFSEIVNLKEGSYRLSSLQSKSAIEIVIKKDYNKINEIEFNSSDSTTKRVESSSGEIKFHLKNNDSKEIVCKLERTDWLENVVTANEVTAMQEFRDLFSSEVLKPGQEIAIKSIAILFTDLKGSTKFYNERGDAFAYKTVSDHFEVLTSIASNHNGAIVKTIGDAIMGVFTNPLEAVQYGIDIQAGIRDLNKKYGEEIIIIKVGAHFGPALAVTMNDKLDYFGQTINLAARTEGQCEGGDMVITEKLYEYPGVKELVSRNKLSATPFSTSIKGFVEDIKMVRLKFP